MTRSSQLRGPGQGQGGDQMITSVRSGWYPDTEARGHWARAGIGGSGGTLSQLGEVNMNNYWVSSLAKHPAENY